MEAVRVDLVDETTGASVAHTVLTKNLGKGNTAIELEGTSGDKFEVVYADIHKGLVEIHQKAVMPEARLAVKFAYVKRGQAGVPTNLDWDGVKGTVIILMNK